MTLEPTYVEETYTKFNLGVNEDKDDVIDSDKLGLTNPPKKSNTRKPPFEIHITFHQYRRNRHYEGNTLST